VTAGLTTSTKRSHASADQRSREGKARRIETILTGEIGSLASKDVLDIGTGAGFIASHFSRLARSLTSLDIVDERVVYDFNFRPVSSERLPYSPETFDVVLSNHVIEHVERQLEHLHEIRRVLRPTGVCYLATPNQFSLLEPHYNLPLLSWLPKSLRSGYVGCTHRGVRYDVQPLSFGRLSSLAGQAGLSIEDLSCEVAIDVIYQRLGFRLSSIMKHLRPLYPSFVVLLRRRQS
jgi:SAM-dependent methyltransferase